MALRIYEELHVKREFAAQLFELFAIPTDELRGDRWIDDQIESFAAPAGALHPDLAQQVDRERLARHHVAQTAAIRTIRAELAGKILADALTRELEKAEVGERLDRAARPVALQRFGERIDDLLPAALVRHVDEVDDDDAADVAQPDLPCDLRRRFDVRADERVLEVPATGELTGVDVDDGQRFGMLEDQIAAGRQHDLRLQQFLELFVDAARFEEVAGPFPQLEPAQVLRAEQGHRRSDLVVLLFGVDDHLPHVAGHEIANGF